MENSKYGFTPSPINQLLPMCLICLKVFSNQAMKASRLQEHLNKIRSEEKGKDLSYFQGLEKKYIKANYMIPFALSFKQEDGGLRVSYNIPIPNWRGINLASSQRTNKNCSSA
ncbi:SCAN domain protein [Caerostris extrusa]|uniref:SCAN domain protein n=1 Tax=Caerostris extrusa TaxID=172846 RepID=A0AAV4NJC9_CAEEX|nr:SCAN domain protein [Caerostris extrusa]